MDLRTELAWACRVLYLTGMNDFTLGHISVYDREQGVILMKPRGLGFDEVGPADLAGLDLDGNQVSGPHPAHGEWPIHTEIFRSRPDIASVVHVHPPYATALACVAEPLELLAHDAILFYAGVGLYEGPPDLILKTVEGAALADCLGDRKAVLMRNHGVTVVGEDIAAAVVTAVTLERAAQFQATARTLGQTQPVSPEAAARAAERARGSRRQNHEFFAYLIRQAHRAGLGAGLPATVDRG